MQPAVPFNALGETHWADWFVGWLGIAICDGQMAYGMGWGGCAIRHVVMDRWAMGWGVALSARRPDGSVGWGGSVVIVSCTHYVCIGVGSGTQ